jgi:molybdate transport system substrate-binding protein
MKKIVFLIFFSLFVYSKEVLVAAAANTTYAMPEIIKTFNKSHPDIKIKLILASSGKLSAQIIHGAPFDVFLSANMKYPTLLYKRGFAKTKPKVYAKGAIALFSVKNIDLTNFKNALLKAKLIAIANPKTAPYGEASMEAIKNSGIYQKVLPKIVYAETVSAVIPYTINEADIGVVAKSALFSKNLKKYKNYADVPKNLYKPISQGIILLNDKKEAKMFYEFLLSDKAKEIFKKYGYLE